MERCIAIYWDFENVHASLCTVQLGPEWYGENWFRKQPRLVDIPSIMEYVGELGEVALNRAYANWRFFSDYSDDLQKCSTDLIQLFPRGGRGKNGADIRMGIDVIEDVTFYPHITDVVIISGDSDFVSVAQRVRQKGRHVVGIGVKETTNRYWVTSCNEFKFYSSLLVKSAAVDDIEAEGYEPSDMDEAKNLVAEAVSRLSKTTGEREVVKAAIKPAIMRLDSSFDESNYGFRSFGELLDACRDVVSVTKGTHDHLVTLCDKELASPRHRTTRRQIHPYERLLNTQTISLPKPGVLPVGLRKTFELFEQIGTVGSYDEFCKRLVESCDQSDSEFLDVLEVGKIERILFKGFCFHRNRQAGTVALHYRFRTAEELQDHVMSYLVRTVLDVVGPADVDIVGFSTLLWGDAEHVTEIQQMIDRCSGGFPSSVGGETGSGGSQ